MLQLLGKGEFVRILLSVLKWCGIVVAALIAFLFVVIVVLPPLTRSFTNHWGATKAEVSLQLPGDEFVKEPLQDSTRAITIKAPPALVYALVKQMGYQRGGWYAWDWFYNATGSGEFVDGHHSTRIDPTLQRFGKGDSMYLFPGAGLKALVADSPTSASDSGALVLYKKTDGANKLVAPDATPPVFSDMSWAWIVQPEGAGGSRLILRTRSSDVGQPRWLMWINDGPLEMGGAIFGYKTLVGIKKTAETLAKKGVAVDSRGRQTAGPQ
jgi:hypothetical protein